MDRLRKRGLLRRDGMLRGGSLLRTAAGTAAGVVLLAGGGAVAAGQVVPSGAGTEVAPVPAAEVPAGDYTAVCPGPPKLLQGAVQNLDPAFSPEATTARTSVSTMVLSDAAGALPRRSLSALKGKAALKGGEALQNFSGPGPAAGPDEGLGTRKAAVLRGQGADSPAVLTVGPGDGRPSTAGALMEYTATDGDLRGLTTAGCLVPGNDFWIVGAATTVGSTAVLKLHNPSETSATVDLELHGDSGLIEAGGTRGLLLPPGESESIVLAGLATDQERLAVRVRSDGGRIAAAIQHSVLRGLTPGGVELLQPTAPPSNRQVIPGVWIQDREVGRKIGAQRGYGSFAPEVQVVVPGSTDAVLDVRVYGPDGRVKLPGGGVFTAAAGSVSSIPLGSLPAGNHSIEVSSDIPVVAAARVGRGSRPGSPVDVAYPAAGERLGSSQVAVLPQRASSWLVFSAPSGEAELRLTPVAADGSLGKETVVSVAGESTVSASARELGADVAAVLVSAAGDPVYGAQVHFQTGNPAGVSSAALAPVTTGRQRIPVDLGY